MLPWYAVSVSSRKEAFTATVLRGKGLEVYLPTYILRRRAGKRTTLVHQPLFPGYIFSRLDLNNRLPVLVTQGVVAIVGFGGRPMPLPDNDVLNVQRMVESGQLAEPVPYLEVGQRVRVFEGPLAGVDGFLERYKGSDRLILSIALLQRSIAVEVDRETVEPLERFEGICRPINRVGPVASKSIGVPAGVVARDGLNKI